MTLTSARATYGLNAAATPVSTNSSGSVQIGASNASTSFSTANVAYSCRAIIVPSGSFALNLLTGSSSGSTAWTAGVAQVESNTVVAAGGCTSNGTMTLVVTASGMTGSPKNVAVALTTTAHTTAALIAQAAVDALNADTAYSAMFTATRSTATIITTRKPTSTFTVPGGTLNLYAANDATLNINIPSGLGVTVSATSTDTTAGVASAGVKVYDAGSDFEGEALTAIVTPYAVMFSATAGTGVITGGTNDVLDFTSGSKILVSNSAGIPNDTAYTLTASVLADINITVVGKTS
jgi:hypothetical protein